MKYYKKLDNSVWAYEDDGSQDYLITEDMAALSDEELYILTAPKMTKEVVSAYAQQKLDDFARQRNYDSILSACTYATSTNLQFSYEGQIAVSLRDAVWAALYTLLSEVEAGIVPAPTSFEDIDIILPQLTWPS